MDQAATFIAMLLDCRPLNFVSFCSCSSAQELFRPFGHVSRIFLAVDKQTGENRGFAFVNYVHRWVAGLRGFLLEAEETFRLVVSLAMCQSCRAVRVSGLKALSPRVTLQLGCIVRE